MKHPDFEDLLNEQSEKPKSLLKVHKAVPEAPPKALVLKELDLEGELLKQYQKAQEMFDDSYDEPLNQRAQTLNTITGILQAIIKSQQDLYNVERLKTLENTLIAVLQGFPEIKHSFLEAYEKELKKL